MYVKCDNHNFIPMRGLNNGKNTKWDCCPDTSLSSKFHIISSKQKPFYHVFKFVCMYGWIISMYVNQIYLDLGPFCAM